MHGVGYGSIRKFLLVSVGMGMHQAPQDIPNRKPNVMLTQFSFVVEVPTDKL